MGIEAGGRPALLAVVTVPPYPMDNGLSLRVASLLRELGTTWSITLVAPALPPGTQYPNPMPGVARLETVPMVGRMTYYPWQYDVGFLQRKVEQLLPEVRPDALLLWGGSEFLSFGPHPGPRIVVDRIDCSTLTAWRQIRVANTLRRKLGDLSEMMRFAMYERRVSRHADAVVLVGAADAATMRRLSGINNVHVISNGVAMPEELPSTGEESSHPTVTFTGVLSYPPNVEAALYFAHKIFPLVRTQEPTAEFVIAGRLPCAEILALATMPSIRVVADVPDMRRIIAATWVSIAPMRSGSGVKNKILEAWAMGKPVVMTGLAANGLSLNSQVSSLVAESPSELAQMVVDLMRNPDRRREVGHHSQELVRNHHSWKGAASMLSALLHGRAITPDGAGGA